MKQLSELLSYYNEDRPRVATLCKYISDSTDVIEGLFRDRLIRFTQPHALNDPMEANPNIRLDFGDDETNYTRYVYQDVALPSYRDLVYLNLIEARYNRYGILSLTRNPYSHEMWNLYSNAHRGFMIEFKRDLNEGLCFKSEHLLSGHVEYVENYELNVQTRLGDSGYEGYDYLNRQLFLRKTVHWKHENEYRIVRPLSECPDYVPPSENKAYRDDRMYLFGYDPSCISAIVFGAAMIPEKKRLIMDLASGFGVRFLQSLMDKSDNFRLYYLPTTSWKTPEKFLSMMPQLFMTNGREFQFGDLYKTVRLLKDIPYFKEGTVSASIMTYLRRKGVRRFKGL